MYDERIPEQDEDPDAEGLKHRLNDEGSEDDEVEGHRFFGAQEEPGRRYRDKPEDPGRRY
jgi:hypothetical protein